MMKMRMLFTLLLPLVLINCGTSQNERNQNVSERIHALRDSIDNNVYKDIQGIMVYQHGQVIVEEYFNGTSNEDLIDARSVGKSIASAILGIALEEGHIKSLDQPLSDFYDLKEYKNYSPDKDNVTIRNILTMSSNFYGDDDDFDTPGNEEYMYDKDNWVQWTLDLPMDSLRKSGDTWHYFTAGVMLLGDIMDKSVPGGLEVFAEKKLFGPLNNTNYTWSYTPQDVPSTAGNFRTNTKGFADFGQLYLQEGVWQGKQVITKNWIQGCTSKKIETKFESVDYGYLWWIRTYTVDSLSYQTAYCSGNGGNKIFTFKALDAVVVINATAYGTSYGHKQADEILTSFLLPEIIAQD